MLEYPEIFCNAFEHVRIENLPIPSYKKAAIKCPY